MNFDEQKILNMFRAYTPKLLESIGKAIENTTESGFDKKVFAYHALKHRMSTYMGYAFEDIAATFGVGMVNLNLDQYGNRPKSKRVKGVDLENSKYCIQLKSSMVSENGTGKKEYDKALKKSAKKRNRIPMIAIAICDKPRNRRITHEILYAEGKDFWENYIGISYESIRTAKKTYEEELQITIDNILNKTAR